MGMPYPVTDVTNDSQPAPRRPSGEQATEGVLIRLAIGCWHTAAWWAHIKRAASQTPS